MNGIVVPDEIENFDLRRADQSHSQSRGPPPGSRTHRPSGNRQNQNTHGSQGRRTVGHPAGRVGVRGEDWGPRLASKRAGCDGPSGNRQNQNTHGSQGRRTAGHPAGRVGVRREDWGSSLAAKRAGCDGFKSAIGFSSCETKRSVSPDTTIPIMSPGNNRVCRTFPVSGFVLSAARV